MATGLEIRHVREIHLIRWTISFVLFAATAACLFYGYRWYTTGELPPVPIPVASADPTIDESPVTKDQTAGHVVDDMHPRYLSISSLNVAKTRVMSVDVDENNLLEVPKNINDVGWFKKSRTPGEGTGAVVIDGHSKGMTNDGVFAKLHTLKSGDEIQLERGDGAVFTYAVVDVRTMTIEQVSQTGMEELMYSAELDKEGLSLIASSGTWIPKQQIFDHRVMLRAVRIN